MADRGDDWSGAIRGLDLEFAPVARAPSPTIDVDDVDDVEVDPRGAPPLPEDLPPAPPDDFYENGSDGPTRRKIMLGTRVDLNELDAIQALAAHVDVYQRAGRLVRVVSGQIHSLSPDALGALMSKVADFERTDKDGEIKPCAPPVALTRGVAAAGVYPDVRVLDGVVAAPIVHPDGTVTDRPGYNASSRLVYQPAGARPPLLDRPTQADAAAAARRLLEVVDEFPWRSTADLSAWLALVISLVARAAIDGPAPLFVASANQARVGKTRLIQLAERIAHGRDTAATAFPSEAGELRKRVDAFVFAGTSLVLFDNVRSAIVGEALEAVLTSSSYGARRLGTSDVREVHGVRTVWAVSANGAAYAGDMAPRTLPIRLYLEAPHPEERAFRRPDLGGWVAANRARLLADAITIPQAYLRAGRPDMKLKPWGSYEVWSGVVRGALVWCGLPDPIETRGGIGDLDQGESAHDRLVALASAVFGDREFTAGALAKAIDSPALSSEMRLGGDFTVGDARDVAGDLGVWDRTAQRVDRHRLGKLLPRHADRPTADGSRVSAAIVDGKQAHDRTGAAKWCVVAQGFLRMGSAGVPHG